MTEFRRALSKQFQAAKNTWLGSRGMYMSIGAGVTVLALGYGAYESIYRVEPGHAAIMYSRWSGVGRRVVGEGMNFKVPWLHSPQIFLTRVRPTTFGTVTGSKDLQTVNITLRILYKPMRHHLPEIYDNLGQDYDDRVLPSIANEVLKSVVAKFNASQLIMERELVSSLIRQRLIERATEFFVEIEDVSITHLAFSPEYAKAVERKQVALQEAQQAKYTVERALQEKRSTIVRAEGDAQSAKLLSEAVKANPLFLEFRRLEAARDIATILAASQNKVYTSSDQLLLNLAESIKPPV